MNSDAPLKEDLPKELRRIINTLTDDVQNAALKKCRELELDPNKGRISLEETLINIGQARDILLDAIEKSKFVQLPLKLQYSLFEQVQAVARELTELTNGTDAVLNLDAAVEELTASVWQFQLHNLSDQVLGFHGKMNQLKSQETRIRQVAREAEEFASLHQQANQLFAAISERSRSIAEEHVSGSKLIEQIQTSLREATELGQKISTLATQVEHHETIAGQQLANAKQAAADTEAIAAKSKELRTEIESARDSLQELTTKTQHLLTSTETAATSQLSDSISKYEQLHKDSQAAITALTIKLETAVADLSSQATTRLDSLTGSADSRVTQLVSEAATRLTAAEASHESRLVEQLRDFTTKSATAVQTFVDAGEELVKSGDTELKRLVGQLDELEGRIRDSIERATGFTLFHAFQRRQLDIAKSKRFWGIALVVAVGVSLLASGGFIYSLQYVQNYNAAFYLKLSISIPLIYAIAFCNVQYSRERRLEEEYAFKSSVSISLDPYQRLVGTLVDKGNQEEVAKYTSFIISAVNRVFTSPTDPISESPGGKNYAEKIIKAVGDVIEPVVKALIKR